MTRTATSSSAAMTDNTAAQARRRSAGAYAPPRMLLPPAPEEPFVNAAESESPWKPCSSNARRSLHCGRRQLFSGFVRAAAGAIMASYERIAKVFTFTIGSS